MQDSSMPRNSRTQEVADDMAFTTLRHLMEARIPVAVGRGWFGLQSLIKLCSNASY